MVVDTIKKSILYFINSKEPAAKIAIEVSTTTVAPEPAAETMSAPIVPNNDDVQSLYSFVENGLKDNVSASLTLFHQLCLSWVREYHAKNLSINTNSCVSFAMVRSVHSTSLIVLLLSPLLLVCFVFTIELHATPLRIACFIYPNSKRTAHIVWVFIEFYFISKKEKKLHNRQ